MVKKFKNGKFHPKFCIPRLQNGRGLAGIWGCISYKGTGICYIYTGPINHFIIFKYILKFSFTFPSGYKHHALKYKDFEKLWSKKFFKNGFGEKKFGNERNWKLKPKHGSFSHSPAASSRANATLDLFTKLKF
ncbi:hypothetical protein BpHYR1_031753 [Brachionus plicatilis]|uniref:Uncharacterized protein n=1 Tax=Brachionus plicatilis TaxID=10195 RepID=A0A3M7PPM7_BRAPC|nr:hypothetical protein BpHYR1_031753 [Brachionus plicatilis]